MTEIKLTGEIKNFLLIKITKSKSTRAKEADFWMQTMICMYCRTHRSGPSGREEGNIVVNPGLQVYVQPWK